MVWFERIVLFLFVAALVLWGVTAAAGDESGFGLVVLSGALVAVAAGRRVWKRARRRTVQW